MDFIVAKDDVGGGVSWRYETCKALVKSSPTNISTPSFFTGQMHFLLLNQECQSNKGKQN